MPVSEACLAGLENLDPQTSHRRQHRPIFLGQHPILKGLLRVLVQPRVNSPSCPIEIAGGEALQGSLVSHSCCLHLAPSRFLGINQKRSGILRLEEQKWGGGRVGQGGGRGVENPSNSNTPAFERFLGTKGGEAFGRPYPKLDHFGYGSKLSHQESDRSLNRPCFHLPWQPILGLPYF